MSAEKFEYQFNLNAKLAGRSASCGNRAEQASMRAASLNLARVVLDASEIEVRMSDFDRRARLQRSFTDRANNKQRACERIVEQLLENLRYTRLITPKDVLPDPP